MNDATLADAVLLLHLGYVAFTVGGEALVLLGAALGWRWVRGRAFRLTHLAAVALVAVESLAGALCPLTVWEYRLREAAGGAAGGGEPASLVARLIHAVIFYDFPAWFFVALYVTWTAVVVATFLAVPPARRGDSRSRRRRG
jgi:hypothetical protein